MRDFFHRHFPMWVDPVHRSEPEPVPRAQILVEAINEADDRLLEAQFQAIRANAKAEMLYKVRADLIQLRTQEGVSTLSYNI
jgi:hypothetical protein